MFISIKCSEIHAEKPIEPLKPLKSMLQLCGTLLYFNCIQKHWIFISWAQWFWTRPSGGRSLIHEFLTGQSCIIGLSVPSATLWCNWRSVRRLSDRHLTRERMFWSANFALRVFHTEWNRKSFKMNFQRIQLDVSPIFSESRRGNVTVSYTHLTLPTNREV